MHVSDIFYPSSSGSNTIVAKIWAPEQAPKGIIQISHGMCEYIDRYEPLAQFLTSNSYIVCANNHLGHGATAGKEEDLGYFAAKGGDRFIVDDVYTLTRMVRTKYPNLPIILLGHSMGSFIARNYITLHGNELNGAILCGTAGPNKSIGLAQKIAQIEEKRKGPKHRSSLLKKLAFGNYNRRFAEKHSENDWLSRDLAVVDAYDQDPFCNFVFTVSAFQDLFSLLQRCNQPEWFASYPKQLPTFLIAGSMDPVGGYGKGVQFVYQTLRAAGVKHVSCKLYPDARHEIFNETDKEMIYEDLLNWIESAALTK